MKVQSNLVTQSSKLGRDWCREPGWDLARVNSELILSSENGTIIPKLPFIIKKMQQMNQISSSNNINLNAWV